VARRDYSKIITPPCKPTGEVTETFNAYSNQMEDSTQTPLIDFAPKAVATVILCQEILAKYIVPDSGISDSECINQLIGVLDNKELVAEMKKLKLIK